MKQLRVLPVLAMSVAVLPGCASITSSEMQTLALTATDASGAAVEKANCVLKNDKGEWTATTPAQIPVRRSPEDLIVTCKKEGSPDGLLRAVSRAAGGMFGNIIVGGGIGALVDHNTGKGYNYPDDLPVKMGSSVSVDRRTQNEAQRPQ